MANTLKGFPISVKKIVLLTQATLNAESSKVRYSQVKTLIHIIKEWDKLKKKDLCR
jgi:hypothetical protein